MQIFTYKVKIGAPDVPRNFSITVYTATTITLLWTENTESDFASYNLYRSTDGVNYGLPYRYDLIGDTFTDTGLTPSTVYFYKLTCEDTDGNESGFSTVASVQTPAS